MSIIKTVTFLYLVVAGTCLPTEVSKASGDQLGDRPEKSTNDEASSSNGGSTDLATQKSKGEVVSPLQAENDKSSTSDKGSTGLAKQEDTGENKDLLTVNGKIEEIAESVTDAPTVKDKGEAGEAHDSAEKNAVDGKKKVTAGDGIDAKKGSDKEGQDLAIMAEGNANMKSSSKAESWDDMQSGGKLPESNKLLKVYWINLDQDTERRANMESQIPLFSGVEWERVPGVDIKEFEKQPDLDLIAEGKCRNDPPSGGCGSDFAHRRAYKRIADQNQDGYYMVAEDDVTFNLNWLSEWEHAAANMPDDQWPMLRICWWDHRTWNGKDDQFRDKETIEGNSVWLRGTKCKGNGGNCFEGACGVVLTPRKAQQLLDIITPNKAGMADDWTGGYVLRNPVVVPRDDSWGKSSREDPSTPHHNYVVGGTGGQSADATF